MPPPTAATFDLVQVATGFINPEDVQQPNDGGGRLLKFEEVDMLTPQQGGTNMGWNIREGTHPFSTTYSQTGNTLTDPIFDYDHTQGDVTVIGGHVYHGTKMPALMGAYVFGD